MNSVCIHNGTEKLFFFQKYFLKFTHLRSRDAKHLLEEKAPVSKREREREREMKAREEIKQKPSMKSRNKMEEISF